MKWWIGVLIVVAACSNGTSPETVPCGLFHEFAVDVQAGTLNNAEARDRIVEIERRSVGSAVADEARELLAALTQEGNSTRFNEAVSEMSAACDAYR